MKQNPIITIVVIIVFVAASIGGAAYWWYSRVYRRSQEIEFIQFDDSQTSPYPSFSEAEKQAAIL